MENAVENKGNQTSEKKTVAGQVIENCKVGLLMLPVATILMRLIEGDLEALATWEGWLTTIKFMGFFLLAWLVLEVVRKVKK